MASLFRHHLARVLIAMLALVAMGGVAADAGATGGAQLGHQKTVHKAKKKKAKKKAKKERKGSKKSPPRSSPVRTTSPPVVPQPPVTPVKPPVTPVKPPVTPVVTPTPPAIGPLDGVRPFPAGMSLFSPTSFWNRQLPADEPLDPRSAQLVTALSNEVTAEIAGRTGPYLNMSAWSVPVYSVGAGVPNVHVTLDTTMPQLQRDFDAVPIPAGVHVAAGSDRVLVIYQPSTDITWEFWHMQLLADGWHARWGGKMTNVSTSAGYFPNSFGASATSLPMLGGLTTIGELKARKIDHALAMAAPNTDWDRFTFPAQRGDGRVTGPTAVPEGTQFRIDPSVDLSKLGLTPVGLAFARAAQRYGIVLRDSADCVTFYVEDPTGIVADPYKELLDGMYPNHALKNFPWDRLQVVAPRTP
jgi:hypothetical protein